MMTDRFALRVSSAISTRREGRASHQGTGKRWDALSGCMPSIPPQSNPGVIQMRVDALMSKVVAACSPSDSRATATRIVWDRDIGFLPVIDAESRPVGTITDRDVAMAAYMKGCPLTEIPVGELMATKVCCSPADAEVAAVEEMMQDAQIRRIPVVGGGHKLVGVISVNDLTRASVDAKVGGGVKPAEVAAMLAVIGMPRGEDAQDTAAHRNSGHRP